MTDKMYHEKRMEIIKKISEAAMALDFETMNKLKAELDKITR